MSYHVPESAWNLLKEKAEKENRFYEYLKNFEGEKTLEEVRKDLRGG